jgi:hypothetical protein
VNIYLVKRKQSGHEPIEYHARSRKAAAVAYAKDERLVAGDTVVVWTWNEWNAGDVEAHAYEVGLDIGGGS